MLSRPDGAAKVARDAFLADVRERLSNLAPANLEDFDAAETLVRRAEEGYRLILGFRARLAVAAWPGERVAAALLRLAERRLVQVSEALDGALARDGIMVPGRINIGDAGDPPVDPDAAMNIIVTTLGGTLMMEAYGRGWFDADGALHLPALPEVSEQELAEAEQDEALGRNWNRWRRLEETARFHGGRIELDAPAELRAALPEEVKSLRRSPNASLSSLASTRRPPPSRMC